MTLEEAMIFLAIIIAIILVWFAYQHGVTSGFAKYAERWGARMKRLEKERTEAKQETERALREIGKLSEENRRMLQEIVKQVEG
ncbi:MAG: hypothetical protein ACYCUI_15275 [Vulcanimicrobiaceae bacterium]